MTLDHFANIAVQLQVVRHYNASLTTQLTENFQIQIGCERVSVNHLVSFTLVAYSTIFLSENVFTGIRTVLYLNVFVSIAHLHR